MELNQSSTLIRGKSFRFYMGTSFAFHVLVVVIFILIGRSFLINLNQQKMTNLKLLQASVKVDVVAMPKLSLQELKKIDQAIQDNIIEEKLETPKSKSLNDSEIVFKKKTSKKNFLTMLKKLGDKETEKVKKKNPKEKMLDREYKELQSLVLKGNKIRKGQVLTGDNLSSAEMKEFSSYMISLSQHVRPNWSLPEYMMNKDLRCRIQIFFKPDGQLIKTQLYESSGLEEYDKRALSAITKSVPLPAVPTKFKSMALNGNVVLGFPL